MPTRTWELWESEEDGSSFFPSDHPQKDEEWFKGKDAVKVWEVVAHNYNQAKRLQHAYYNWEPY